MNRRALLASFLAAPVAVRFAPPVEPLSLGAYLDSLPLETENAVMEVLLGHERASTLVLQQFVDAALLASEAPYPFTS